MENNWLGHCLNDLSEVVTFKLRSDSKEKAKAIGSSTGRVFQAKTIEKEKQKDAEVTTAPQLAMFTRQKHQGVQNKDMSCNMVRGEFREVGRIRIMQDFRLGGNRKDDNEIYV